MKEMKEIPKCCSLLIIDVVWFTPMSRTLQKLLHRLHRTLKLCSMIPSFSDAESTPGHVRHPITIAGLKRTLGLAY